MDNYTERIQACKAKVEQAKTERARAEATIESLNKQMEQIVAELAALGVTPETLDANIERLDAEIREGLEKAERLLASV